MSSTVDFRPKNTVATPKSGAPVISDSEHVFESQQFHKLALAITERLPEKKRARVLSVTGVDTTVGKTLTSLNLAISLARGGERRVLLIEGDLWRPGLAQYLESHPALPGLSHVLSDSSALSNAILDLGDTGCHLLLAGERTSSGKDLICSRRMAEMIVWAGSRYEFVVIDCPPLGTAAAQYLARISDGTAIVVGAGKTKKRHLEHALEDLGPKKVLGLILNGVREDDLSYYAYPSGPSRRRKTAGLSVLSAKRGNSARFGRQRAGKAIEGSPRRRNLLLVLSAILVGALVAWSVTRWRPDWLPAWVTTGSPEAQEQIPAEADPSKAPAETLESPEPQADGAEKKNEPVSSEVQSRRRDPSPSVASGRVTTRLNLRSNPGTEHEVLATLPVGLDLEIAAFQSGWLKVRAGDQEGWVHRSGVEIESPGRSGGAPTSSSAPGPTRETAEALASNPNQVEEAVLDSIPARAVRRGVARGQVLSRLNLRLGPGLEHELVETLPVGLEVTVLGTHSDWLRVSAGGRKGWVYRPGVQIIRADLSNGAPTATAPTTETSP